MNQSNSKTIVKELVLKAKKAQLIFEKFNQNRLDEVFTVPFFCLF
tara:strand:- start:339 stop:473 length:135 start_codon:yes stop_codon:yes gene_type:complete